MEKSTAIGEGARGTLSCHHRHIFIVFFAFFFSFKACYDSKLFPGPFQQTGLLGTGLALSPFFESYHGVI